MSARDIHCPECGCQIDSDIMSADPMRRRFFAALRDAWASLPDQARERFPSSEVLRKTALIAIGHCDVMTVVAGSQYAAPLIANAFKSRDQYCIAVPRDDVVTVYTARSMARRVLHKKEFHDVSDKVFHWIAETTGVDPARSDAARAA